MTIKAILDTNVVISGIFWKGPPLEILQAWQEQRFRLAISLPILDEYRRVLEEMMRKRSSAVLDSILELIELHSEIVEPARFAKTVCSDPDVWGALVRGILEQKTRNPWDFGCTGHLYRDGHDHSVHARRLGCLCRIPAMTEHVAFLMKDIILFAASVYLLKQDVARVALSNPVSVNIEKQPERNSQQV